MSAPELVREDDDAAELFGLWLCREAETLKPFTHAQIVSRVERLLFEQRATLDALLSVATRIDAECHGWEGETYCEVPKALLKELRALLHKRSAQAGNASRGEKNG